MQLEQISIKINNQTIINPLDLKIKPNEIFVLMGPSGSGKTTLLKGIAGLLPLTSGKIVWEMGQGSTGLVFQEPRLFPHLTVFDNIAFGLRVRRIPARNRKKMVREFLKNLQLDELEDRYPHQLSGGQQQRVSLGRALILQPQLLLLDEPFASLDTSLREDLIEWLISLQRSLGFSILWVTHYLDEALSAADRIGILLDGSIQQTGSPIELFQKPNSDQIAQFLSLPNRFRFEQWNKWFQGKLNLAETDHMGWIDPNYLGYIQTLNEESQQECVLSGQVKRVRPRKDGYSLTVLVDQVTIEMNLAGWGQTPSVNQLIKIRVPLERIHWYGE